MSSNIIGDLHNATKALNAHRFGVTTAGTNMSNVNNPEYARQRAILGDRGVVNSLVGPRGLGVEVTGFQHMRDAVLDKEILRETSIKGSLDAELAALQKAEASIGQQINRQGDSAFVDGAQTDGSGSGGIAEVLNDFFNSFHSLSANPASDAEKESLIQKSRILTEKLNVTSERFTDLQADITSEVETDLDTANDLISEIARLNTEIARAEASHAGQALSLRDSRQARLDELSEIMQINVTTIDKSGGQIKVTIPTISGNPATVDLVNRGTAVTLEFDDSVPGVPSFNVKGDTEALSIKGGSIHGALAARDGEIASFLTGMNTLASSLVQEVNNIYNPGAVAGENFFDDSNLTAAGISVDSNLNSTTLRTGAIGATEQGDNAIVLAIAELGDSKLGDPTAAGATNLTDLGDRTFGAFFRAQASDLAEAVASVESRADDEATVFNLLKQQRDAVSGVSLDEEMADMIKFQRAYEATGKLIRTIDEMLDVIINRLI
ncbi:MAG: flagellar hook-associated protein FlgK [Verrucomicrobiota bacterium]